ncbi:VWA domain-containing protein [Spirillospora sp. NPDC127200]
MTPDHEPAPHDPPLHDLPASQEPASHDLPASPTAASPASAEDDGERLRRWRLVLGGSGSGPALTGDDARMDAALEKLYGTGEGRSRPGPRSAGLGDSAPSVARWLGDIRAYFPSPVVQVMQKDALERLNLTRLLLEPELLDAVEPDVHLVGTLLSLTRVLPDRARESARAVVRKVVADLEERLARRTRSAVGGALDRAARGRRPRRPSEVDWDRTIRANLHHYLPAHRTLVPERMIGHARRRDTVEREVILALDQSGSMASSVVHAGVLGAALAALPSLRTRLVAFDTAVTDLTEHLHDPVELLFGTQLGGGTDVNRALAYCQGLVTRPADTVLVLVSDLFEGGRREEMLQRAAALTAAGVRMVVLLALSDEGAPAHDHDNAAALAALGVPAFACTPDAFPELMAAAIEGRDLADPAGPADPARPG